MSITACTGTIAEAPLGGEAPADGPSATPDLTAPPEGRPPAAGSPAASQPPVAGHAASRCANRAVRAPLRRLTPFEYDNTVRDLLGDETSPGQALPGDETGNGFGNDADALSVSSLLAEQYAKVAEGIAARATRTPEALARLAPCARAVTAATEAACARELIARFAPRAYRRPLASGELDELLAFQRAARMQGPDFASSIAAVIEAVLQSPDFLYRVEHGVPDPRRPDRRRLAGHEVASRLSYLFWGTMPDAALMAAADQGALATEAGVREQAARLLSDPRSRPVIRYFFDHFLPIGGLAHLERDPKRFPSYSAKIGELLRQETQTFLEAGMFATATPWPALLTAPYTYVNEALASYYGTRNVKGTAFQKAEVDTKQRLGLLTQGGVMAGTAHSNETSPVVRGAYVVKHLLCRPIPLPTGDLLDEIKPPDPYTGKTARERYAQHSADPACVGCHLLMDPVGLALENYDPVGLWRDRENGVLIDASGSVPGVEGTVSGPTELVRALAGTEDIKSCLAVNWASYAYGRSLGSDADACTREEVERGFAAAGYDLRRLVLSLAQTEDFLSLPAIEE
jgi:hypothetical protein